LVAESKEMVPKQSPPLFYGIRQHIFSILSVLLSIFSALYFTMCISISEIGFMLIRQRKSLHFFHWDNTRRIHYQLTPKPFLPTKNSKPMKGSIHLLFIETCKIGCWALDELILLMGVKKYKF
jgi:hypothetical protein